MRSTKTWTPFEEEKVHRQHCGLLFSASSIMLLLLLLLLLLTLTNDVKNNSCQKSAPKVQHLDIYLFEIFTNIIFQL